MHKNESLKILNYSITFDTCRFSFFLYGRKKLGQSASDMLKYPGNK